MNQERFLRYSFLAGIFTILAAMIVGQMLRFQFDTEQAAKIRKRAEAYSRSAHTVYPARGLIYDRWGHLLAGNTTVYEVGVEVNQVENPHSIALTLNVVLGLDYAQVRQAIESPATPGAVYVVLDDFVPQNKIDLLEQYSQDILASTESSRDKDRPSLAGLVFTPHLQRTYPEHSLASNILGFVGRDEEGRAMGYFGVEARYDDQLAGQPVTVWMPNDPKLVTETPTVPEGTSLILTIDREVQAEMEAVLDNALESSGAESGTIVVIDPKSGEILALATTPRLDLNKYWRYDQVFKKDTPFNRAISQAYEPGSVFKVLTMAAALDKGAVKPETTFLDTGMIEVGGVYIYNWNRGVWGPQDMQGCLQHSLNVCLAWVATQLGAGDFYTYLNAFGIGHLTGVDMSGEMAGRLKVPGDADWYEADLGTNSFGQGVAATPLQMASSIAAVANEGKMMVPHIVKARIIDGVQYDTEPRIAGMPISAETARNLQSLLSRSLEDEASTALVDGYKIAGKTGTAEIPTPMGYTSGQTNASFVGWGPVDDPRFLVYIWLEKPQSSIWGSEVAAPVFSTAASKLVVLLNIPPDRERKALYSQ